MVKKFISALMAAISNCSLYAKDHASVDEFTRKSLKILENLLKESDKFEIMLLRMILLSTRHRSKKLDFRLITLKNA